MLSYNTLSRVYRIVVLLVLYTTRAVLSNTQTCGQIGLNQDVWTDGADNQTYKIDITNKQGDCFNNTSCTNDSIVFGEESVLQLVPLRVPLRVNISLQLPSTVNITILYVYQTDLTGFLSCSTSKLHAAPDLTLHPGDQITLGSLTVGHNYFIFSSSDDDLYSCTHGNRLRITVSHNNCTKDGQTNLCSGHGYCVAITNQVAYTCDCCPGFTGRFCDTTMNVTLEHSCNNTLCQNGGSCIANSSNPRHSSCSCTPYFTGQHCETHIGTACRSNPCVRGVCEERPGTFQCYCIPGYHGLTCELEYDECLSNPCQHGGTCIDHIDKFACRCTRGYTGVTCQNKLDLCTPNPCFHNVTCRDEGNGILCECPSGMAGRLCNIPVNECASNPCQNDGTCMDLDNGFECFCPITFAGVHCEYMMDVFAPPLESSETIGTSHTHNLYIVAGTLSGAILLVLVVLVACYCKMHETYKQLTWRRLRYKKRSLSCSDLEAYGEVAISNKPRLSVDALLEATSLCHDNGTFDIPRPSSYSSQII